MDDSKSDGSRPSAAAALNLPRVVFGSSGLGNLFVAPSRERKLSIVEAWVSTRQQGAGGEPCPVAIDSAGKYGAGLALECIGEFLRELGVPPESVVISNKLGWYRTALTAPEPTFEPGAWVDIRHDAEQRISRRGILECWEQGCEILGNPYRPQLLSVHDPDEYLDAAPNLEHRRRRMGDILDAYDSLAGLKRSGDARAIGLGAKNWRVAKEVADQVKLDWVMIANCLTAFTHDAELLEWTADLAAEGVAVINSAVFNAGFLVGGDYFNYRLADRDSEADRRLFDWREEFNALCARHGVKPAAACVEFGLSPPAVSAVALNTSDAARVPTCVELSRTKCPADFWTEAKQAGLIAADYPHLG